MSTPIPPHKWKSRQRVERSPLAWSRFWSLFWSSVALPIWWHGHASCPAFEPILQTSRTKTLLLTTEGKPLPPLKLLPARILNSPDFLVKIRYVSGLRPPTPRISFFLQLQKRVFFKTVICVERGWRPTRCWEYWQATELLLFPLTYLHTT